MTKADSAFIKTVLTFHARHGRHDLPWRLTTDPYRILVSEMMLQQTQVARVIPRYEAFLKAFPDVQVLAKAPLGAVIRQWQGLGYNRRAKFLHDAAKEVAGKHQGIFPQTLEGLMTLPGIGPYTASAVMAFAYDEPVVVIETNIRTAYLHHLFEGETGVRDADIAQLIERTMDRQQPRLWYSALMDYGASLKASVGNQNHRSRHYVKQSKFAGSDRQVRGAILRTLTKRSRTRKSLLEALSQHAPERVMMQLANLIDEGLIVRRGRAYSLPQ